MPVVRCALVFPRLGLAVRPGCDGFLACRIDRLLCDSSAGVPSANPRKAGVVMTAIYLDYNATTPLDPAVVDAMLPFLQTHFGNPSSTHEFGRKAHDAVEQARGEVAALMGAQPDEIVFTGGGTEASNHAL